MNQTFTKSRRIERLLKLGRLFFLLYLIFICTLPVSAFAQSGKFTISEKQITVRELFRIMKEQQKGLDFFYSNDEFNAAKKIDINVSNATLDELMKIILANKYTYELIDNHLVIKPRVNNLKVQKDADPHNIGGIVTDKDGRGIPGVVVKAKLAKTISATDINGKYVIHVHDNDVLEFTYVGFEKQELNVNGKSRLDVSLKEDVAFLNEVVVTGYQSLQRKNTTGAYSGLNLKDIEQRNNVTLDRLLEGTIPGLSVYKGVNGANDLQIRGGSSLRSGTQPLFIIDGFASTIQPDINEIENITVLKDAAAAAIWGSQAANGVIVITTKKGKQGKIQVNYSGNTRITNRPDYGQLRRADAPAIIDYQKEQYDKFYIMAPIFDGSPSGYSQSIGIFNDFDRKDITLEERDDRLAKLAGLSNRDQIDNLLLRPSVSQSHFFSLSGGSDKIQSFLSGNYKSDKSGFKGNDADAFTISNRNTYNVTDFLSLRTDLSATYTSRKSGYSGIESATRSLLPYQMLLDEGGNYVYDYSDFNKIENDRLMGLGYLDNGFNLLEENNIANNKTSGWGLKTRVGADWKIVKGLSLSNDFIYEKTTSDNKNLKNKNSFYVRDLVNYMSSTDEQGDLVNDNIPYGDILDLGTANYKNYAFRNQLNYSNTFKGKHYLNVIGGFDLRKTVSQTSLVRQLGYNDDLLTSRNIDAAKLASDGIIWWYDDQKHNYYADSYNAFTFVDNREYSFYSTLAYTFDDRYTLSGSYRTDHSNLFGADPKFRKTPLWSVGGQWNISNEEFFKSELFSNLGLRMTYGLTGNFDRNTQSTTFLVARRFFNNVINDNVARLDTPPNPKLRWERSRTFNLGTDIGMLKGRISISLDYYRKYSYDLLGSQDLDPTVGMTSASVNAANMVNQGIELALKADIIRTPDFSWISNLNLGYNKNKVTFNRITDANPAINRPNGTVPFLEGYARESVWSYKWAGLDHEGRPQVYDADGNKIYEPVEGSLIYSGTARPKLTGGWSNTFKYKGFDAMAFLVFNYGHVVRREMPDMYGYDWSGAYNNQIAQRWRKAGDELITDIPAIPEMQYLSDYYGRAATRSTNSIIDASFIRLREVQFGYSFNSNLLKSTPFKSIRIVAQMNNLYLFKKNKYGIDPEAVIGTDSRSRVASIYALPEPVTTTFGINIGL
ncbi:MAG: SusC/RagA family TonB-linked outer membrane protein [Pedobacter sp.]|uniref:SusC/RagA family TonB-linked outer membrane protein n=1 Tax=Pedobacter sp. TaxID=1411316 RepID=UPI00356A4101